MGWACYIITDKTIDHSHLDTILRNAPQHLQGLFPGMASKQSWGWSSGVDVMMPSMGDEYNLRLGGSYGMSGNIAEEYANWLIEELTKVGYEIKSKEFSW